MSRLTQPNLSYETKFWCANETDRGNYFIYSAHSASRTETILVAHGWTERNDRILVNEFVRQTYGTEDKLPGISQDNKIDMKYVRR